jgi:opacity protein-like surface antigen
MSCITPAYAMTGGYFGIGYSEISYDSDRQDDLKLPTWKVKLGNKFSKYLAIEARYSGPVDDDTRSYLNIDNDPFEVKSRIEQMYGIYLRPMFPIGAFSVYGLAGFTHVDVKEEIKNIGSDTFDEEDFSYGGGVEWYLFPHMSLNVEWARLLDDEHNMDEITGGLNFRF